MQQILRYNVCHLFVSRLNLWFINHWYLLTIKIVVWKCFILFFASDISDDILSTVGHTEVNVVLIFSQFVLLVCHFQRVSFSLRHFGKLSRSDIEAHLHNMHCSIFSDVVTKLIYFVPVIWKVFLSMSEKWLKNRFPLLLNINTMHNKAN